MFLGKVVKIDWIDPKTIGGKWVSLSDVEKSRPMDVVTYGIVVYEDSDTIVTVSHKTADNDVDGDITLPKAIIKTITELNEGSIHSFTGNGISSSFASRSTTEGQQAI